MALLAVFGPFGLPELLILLALVVFLFGARKIPEVARGLGEGIRGFRTSLRGDDSPDEVEAPKEKKPKSTTPEA